MKGSGRLLSFAVLTLFMTDTHASSPNRTSSPPAHVRSSFQFQISASLQRAAHLFGPEGERCWAGPHWDPEFLYPQPAQDIEGAVFTIQHGLRQSIWVNTLFDLSTGRMQYVSFVPDALVTVVDVRLTALAPSRTGVEVIYTRTALSGATDDEVHALGASDRTSGPHWQKAIQGCLKQRASVSNGKD